MEKSKLLEYRTFDESKQIGIEMFDKHHKNFVELLNMLVDVINNNEGNDKIAEVFHKLIFYAENYFFDEELYFKKYNYAKITQHKESHLQILKEIQEFHKRFQEGDKTVCREMMEFIDNWFTEHLLNYDKEAIQFLTEVMR